MNRLLTRALNALQGLIGSETPATWKSCVIGLGNPGEQYLKTRHNIGHRVIDGMARSLGVELRKERGNFLFAECVYGEERFLIVSPLTFMNESGMAVEEVMKQFRLQPADLIIVHDDFQLPLGTLRIRREGGDGGHHGLASVIRHLQSERVPRLRIGIAGKGCPAKHTKDLMAGYVLSPFEADEELTAAEMVLQAERAVFAWIHSGIQYAMNHFNKSLLCAGVTWCAAHGSWLSIQRW